MADFDDDGSLDEIDNEGSVGVESSEDERYSAEYFGLETDEVENFDEDEEEEEDEEDEENFTATQVAELAFTGRRYVHLESGQLPDSLFDNDGREKILWWSRSEELEVSGYVDIDANAWLHFSTLPMPPFLFHCS